MNAREARTRLQNELKKTNLRMRQWYRNVYLISEHWFNLRLKAFLTHGRNCQKCKSNKLIQVHHLRYRSIYDVLVSDLQVLCRICHKKEHKKLNKKVSVFQGFPDIPFFINQLLIANFNSNRCGYKAAKNKSINIVIAILRKQNKLTDDIKNKLMCHKSGKTARKLKKSCHKKN